MGEVQEAACIGFGGYDCVIRGKQGLLVNNRFLLRHEGQIGLVVVQRVGGIGCWMVWSVC